MKVEVPENLEESPADMDVEMPVFGDTGRAYQEQPEVDDMVDAGEGYAYEEDFGED